MTLNDVVQKKRCVGVQSETVRRVCHRKVTVRTLKYMLYNLMAKRATSCVCELRPALNVPISIIRIPGYQVPCKILKLHVFIYKIFRYL